MQYILYNILFQFYNKIELYHSIYVYTKTYTVIYIKLSI